jgi:uncharacterized membrane protein
MFIKKYYISIISKKNSFLRSDFIFVLFLIPICFFLSIFIPPLKSPDEHDHIKRAYLLSKGVLVLDHQQGKSSGGKIDTGLLKYLNSFPPYQDKLSLKDIASFSDIKWSKERVYDIAPGTGYYFPIIYLPQALGLLLGEVLNFSIDFSYKLSRAFAIISSLLLLFIAFKLHPSNPVILALLAMPMTIFQLSSASLDGIATSLAIFSISSFLHLSKFGNISNSSVQYTFPLAIAILASSRIHTLPLITLLVANYFNTKQKRSIFLSLLVCFFVFGWTLYAIKTTVDLRVIIGAPPSKIILFYLQNPFQFFSVLWATVNNLLNFYIKSFIGILGWLDVPFKKEQYNFFKLLISMVVLITFSFKRKMKRNPHFLLLLILSIISVLFIFFALLVTWSSHPALIISGVQGRYFLIPSIVLAYGIFEKLEEISASRRIGANFLVFFLLIYSLHSSIKVLIDRYY